jgi:hypothetical protein
MRFWAGPFEWKLNLVGTIPGWAAPAQSRLVFDLRTLAQSASSGPVPSGKAIFVTADAVALGSPYREIPDSIGPAARNAIENELEITGVTATNRRQLMIDFLTQHADPDGVTFSRPLLPGSDGRLRVALLDGEFFHALDPSSPYWAKIVRVYQEAYRAHRLRVLAGQAATGFHRRFLGRLIRKLKFDYHLFIPNDLPGETPLEPQTTITDNFNRADAGTLGSSSEGWSWAAVNGNMEIVGNEAHNISGVGGARQRAESDLSSDDHYAQVVDVANASGCLAVRFSASADTAYLFITDSGRIFKCETGSLTELAASSTPSPGSVQKLQCNGSLITIYDDGVQMTSVVDTAIVGHTRTGMYADNSSHMDNFEASDLDTRSRFLLTRF